MGVPSPTNPRGFSGSIGSTMGWSQSLAQSAWGGNPPRGQHDALRFILAEFATRRLTRPRRGTLARRHTHAVTYSHRRPPSGRFPSGRGMESVRSRQTAIDNTIIVALRPGINPAPRRRPPITPHCRRDRRKLLRYRDFVVSDSFSLRRGPATMGTKIPRSGAD